MNSGSTRHPFPALCSRKHRDYSWAMVQRLGVAFLPIPKNANTYLKGIFLHNATRGAFDLNSHSPSDYLSSHSGRGIFPVSSRVVKNLKLERMLVLRDPRSRLVSAFLDKLVKKATSDPRYLVVLGSWANKSPLAVTFLDLLQYISATDLRALNKHFRPQFEWVRRAGGLEAASFVGTTEAMSHVEGFLLSRGFEIPRLAKNRKSPAHLKVTPYDNMLRNATSATVGDLQNLSALPPPDAFFGDEESGLFNQVYELDLELLYRISNSAVS